VVKLAIDLGLEKMVAQLVESQDAARKTFERLGFRQEADSPARSPTFAGAKRDPAHLRNDVHTSGPRWRPWSKTTDRTRTLA